jgi:hypothetical protein
MRAVTAVDRSVLENLGHQRGRSWSMTSASPTPNRLRGRERLRLADDVTDVDHVRFVSVVVDGWVGDEFADELTGARLDDADVEAVGQHRVGVRAWVRPTPLEQTVAILKAAMSGWLRASDPCSIPWTRSPRYWP